jgi:DNA-binding winged helix-turn-helix (wHTH) protein/TolB-like protein/predicted negative regulator of RcsB-dependent stress response
MTDARTSYEFGDFELDVAQQRLSRRDGGSSVPLTGKAFDALVYLVEHAGEALDKDTLLRAIWPGAVVEENSLTQVISSLRQLLGEERGENRYIATLPRKGYRFVAEVRQRVALPPMQQRKRRGQWLSGVAFLLLAAFAIGAVVLQLNQAARNKAPVRTLAILPFKPLVPEQSEPSLEFGMADSLISQLAQRGDQVVSPLSSVRRYAAVDQDALAAGRELKVDTVLDGLIQRQDDRLRVSVHLLRVADGRQLWTQVFDQPFTDILEVQDTIATRIAKALSMQAPSAEMLARRHGTSDPEAYVLYASGRFAFSRLTEATLLQAIDFYRQAVTRDPSYARAYAGLADCYSLLGVIGARAPHETFPLARAAVDKALELDPQLASAYTARAQVRAVYDFDANGALQDLNRAAEVDPELSSIYFYRGVVYGSQGDSERSRQEFQRAQQLEPASLAAPAAAALSLFYSRRYDEAITELRRILALDDNFQLARGFLIRTLLAKGAYDDALQELQGRNLQTFGSYGFRAQALALAGRRDEAKAELDRVLALSKQRYVSAYDIGMIYAALHDKNNTFLWMNRAVDERATAVGSISRDPLLDFIRTDSRFPPLIKRIGLDAAPLQPTTTSN